MMIMMFILKNLLIPITIPRLRGITIITITIIAITIIIIFLITIIIIIIIIIIPIIIIIIIVIKALQSYVHSFEKIQSEL
jgi:hypothetical protein